MPCTTASHASTASTRPPQRCARRSTGFPEPFLLSVHDFDPHAAVEGEVASGRAVTEARQLEEELEAIDYL
jgi:hypothetical protein